VVTLLRISELAEQSGVPPSTLRYYERIGLMEPLGRADNGYRLYDEASLERLAFIGRAKRLGMNLDDVATLVEAWFAGECAPVRERLRSFVTGRLAELRHQIAEEVAFERQLERIQHGLEERRVIPERCGPDCGCDTDPLPEAGPAIGTLPLEAATPPAVCSLGERDAGRRAEEWRLALAPARYSERFTGELRVVFDPSPTTIAELARLCEAETVCCPFFAFTLEITGSALSLSIRSLAGAKDAAARDVAAAADMVEIFFDFIEPPGRRASGTVGSERPMSRVGG
jgi:DNA-binding transcriptional MerR regulator